METRNLAIVVIAAVAIICIAGAIVLMQGGGDKDPVIPPEPDPEFPDLNDKILVVYFSATETTAGFAEKIAEYLGADVYRIVPEIPYTAEDLQRDVPGSRVDLEDKDTNCRPAIAGEDIDLSGYSTIILGFPIWYHKEPKIVDTFLDNYDLSGKNLIPFCTSWSAGIAGATAKISVAEPKAKIISGTDFQSGDSDEIVFAWLESLGLEKKQ